jgi:hypothetical protein
VSAFLFCFTFHTQPKGLEKMKEEAAGAARDRRPPPRRKKKREKAPKSIKQKRRPLYPTPD